MTDAGFVAAGWLLTVGVLAGYGARVAARTRAARATLDASEARRAGPDDDDGVRATGESSW